jgi:predicted methyltransferase
MPSWLDATAGRVKHGKAAEMGFLFVVSQAQRWVTERISAGDIVIDATAGNGSDTLFLARAVGVGGIVYAFDVQSDALTQTQKRLDTAAQHESLAPVILVQAGHENMASQVEIEHHGQAAAVMFNLGYLPGASSAVMTQPVTTLAALKVALQLLRSGGILTIVVYPGHDGGLEEAEAVQSWAADVPSTLAQTVTYRFPQKVAAPYLIALHKQ